MKSDYYLIYFSEFWTILEVLQIIYPTHQADDTEKDARQINDLGELTGKNEDYLSVLNNSTNEVDKLKEEGFENLKQLIEITNSSNSSIKDIQGLINDTN